MVENLNLICNKRSAINIKSSFELMFAPFKNILKDKFKIEYMRRESIIGLRFFKMYCIHLLFLNLLKHLKIIIIITNEGRTTPNVEKILPNIPPFLNPINVLMFMAKGPGVDSDIPINSKISLDVAQEYFKM